jgi:putative tricarboxylic transport membrane protein
MKKLTLTFVVALVLFFGGIGWLTLAWQLPHRTSITTMAGPRTFPVVILIVLVIFSGLLAVVEFKKIRAGAVESFGFEKGDLKSILMIVIAAFLYLMVLNTVGYIVSTASLIAVLFWLFGFRNKVVFVVLVVTFPFLLFFVFQIIMKIPLP